MSSLTDLPRLIGFFSYSRDDDEGDDGALSALSDRIYNELRSQLGRTKDNFQLWRDKDALGAGEIWKEKLEAAVAQSAFFIPMVTPSAVQSPYCQFEFETFLKRERELGRNDLFFPVLYIAVPELAGGQNSSNPVISIVAERQFVDWRSIRHRNASSTEVKQTVEQFCAVIAKKLREKWVSLEEQAAIDEQKRVDEERRRQEQAQRERDAEGQRKALAVQRREQEDRAKREAEEKAARLKVEAEARQQETQRADEELRAKNSPGPAPSVAIPEKSKITETDARIMVGAVIFLIAILLFATFGLIYGYVNRI